MNLWRDKHLYVHFMATGESLILIYFLTILYDLVPLLAKTVVQLATFSMIIVFVYTVLSTWMIVTEFRDFKAQETSPYLIEEQPERLPFPIAPKAMKPKVVKAERISKMELLSQHPASEENE